MSVGSNTYRVKEKERFTGEMLSTKQIGFAEVFLAGKITTWKKYSTPEPVSSAPTGGCCFGLYTELSSNFHKDILITMYPLCT